MCVLSKSELSTLMWIIENELWGKKLVQTHWNDECLESIHSLYTLTITLLVLVLVLTQYVSIAGFLFGWKFESRVPVYFPLVPSRIEQYYEAILALWNQLYINMKSLVSWHYCMIDIEKIRAMTIAKVHPEDHAGCLEEAPSCPLWCSLLPGRPFSRAANLFVSHLKISSACLQGSSQVGWEGFAHGWLWYKKKYWLKLPDKPEVPMEKTHGPVLSWILLSFDAVES